MKLKQNKGRFLIQIYSNEFENLDERIFHRNII